MSGDDTAPGSSRPLLARMSRLLAPALLAGWLVVTTALLLVGERSGDADDLRAQIAAGEVDEVRARGEIGPGGTGSSLVELRWSDSWTNRVTQVVQLRGDARRGSQGDPEVTGRFRGDLADYLTESGGTVTVHSEPHRGGAQTETPLGWELNGAWAVAFGLVWLATFAHLVLGPTPRFATRWAWFWLLALVPVGPIAYLVVGGGLAPARLRSDRIRLRGGWAFILSVAVGAALTSTQ